jgi:uncharacterized protein YbjT (DUF2867 family)
MERYVTSFEEIGRAEGQRELVLRLLEWRIGAIESDLQGRVAALDADQLFDLSKSVLSFTDIADLTTWLDQHECPSDDSAE